MKLAEVEVNVVLAKGLRDEAGRKSMLGHKPVTLNFFVYPRLKDIPTIWYGLFEDLLPAYHEGAALRIQLTC